MSQPRRRRRNRRRRGGSGGGASSEQGKRETVDQSREAGGAQPQQRSNRSRRGRRGRTRGRSGGASSPKSSEDLVRADPKRPPARLTGEHDGTTLEQVIGDLQSEHGVPQHPQEFRITLKVAEDRSERGGVTDERPQPSESNGSAPTTVDSDRPKREKAPAAPRIGSSAADAEENTSPKSNRKRRSRRRRRKPKGSGSA
ncbi:MAG: hypothetical protein M3198_11195 [Actinomycetota bacterium]|nr:hypothetical protein [Actinomycetota bacterium]